MDASIEKSHNNDNSHYYNVFCANSDLSKLRDFTLQWFSNNKIGTSENPRSCTEQHIMYNVGKYFFDQVLNRNYLDISSSRFVFHVVRRSDFGWGLPFEFLRFDLLFASSCECKKRSTFHVHHHQIFIRTKSSNIAMLAFDVWSEYCFWYVPALWLEFWSEPTLEVEFQASLWDSI